MQTFKKRRNLIGFQSFWGISLLPAIPRLFLFKWPKAIGKFFLLLCAIGVLVAAFSPSSMLAESNQPPIYRLKVKGLVCSFCASGIEKRIKKIPGVERAEVNLSKKIVLVYLKSGEKEPTIEQFREAIEDSGYTLQSVTREESDSGK